MGVVCNSVWHDGELRWASKMALCGVVVSLCDAGSVWCTVTLLDLWTCMVGWSAEVS